MRQHVNPLSINFNEIERIPSLIDMFGDSELNLHLDIGCAAGEFLFDLALVNNRIFFPVSFNFIWIKTFGIIKIFFIYFFKTYIT